jgi:hypothetical protein
MSGEDERGGRSNKGRRGVMEGDRMERSSDYFSIIIYLSFRYNLINHFI